MLQHSFMLKASLRSTYSFPKSNSLKESDIDEIVKRAIASSNSLRYNSISKRKPDHVKSRKGGDNGSI